MGVGCGIDSGQFLRKAKVWCFCNRHNYQSVLEYRACFQLTQNWVGVSSGFIILFRWQHCTWDHCSPSSRNKIYRKHSIIARK